jgi:hypothetical protein
VLQPFFTAGFVGLIQAMGYTFIALQGFDLIAAVGGEVRDPSKTLPRAMILSLAIALIIYLPLLFVIATVGTPIGHAINTAAADNPEGIVATAAQQFLGPFGYWLVIVAAVLSMFSALQANLFAASRIARAMARGNSRRRYRCDSRNHLITPSDPPRRRSCRCCGELDLSHYIRARALDCDPGATAECTASATVSRSGVSLSTRRRWSCLPWPGCLSRLGRTLCGNYYDRLARHRRRPVLGVVCSASQGPGRFEHCF